MPGGGTLTIETAAADGRASVSVTDTGAGIAPEHLARLFQPLFTTKARGIGLGLAVARRLAEANGGTIEVRSESGRGSRFTVLLPAAGAEGGAWRIPRC
jgi:signal transduction histidine kinase